MTNKEAINVLNGMRRHVTNSCSESLLKRTRRENEAIDKAIELLKEKKDD